MSINYELYHQHPLNKGIHFVCIPAIVLTSMNFLDEIKFKLFGKEFNGKEIAKAIYYTYYFNISFKMFFIMFFYIMFLDEASYQWKLYDKKWKRNSLAIFILSWALQFYGHYIEGNRPTLVDSITSAAFQAPMYSIKYLTDTITN